LPKFAYGKAWGIVTIIVTKKSNRKKVQESCYGNNNACKRKVVLFNIRDDPYELENIYEQNQAIAQDMVTAIIAQANAITEGPIDVGDVTG